MMKNKSLILALGLLVLALAVPALAAETKAPATEEAREQRYAELYAEYERTVMPLHDKFIAKNQEFQAIKQLPATTKEDIAKVLDETTALKGQMREAAQAFSAKLEKEGFGPYRGFHGGASQPRRGGCPQADAAPCGAYGGWRGAPCGNY